MLKLLMAALVLFCAGPALAQSETERMAAEADQAVRSIMAQTREYNEIVRESTNLLIAIIDRANEAGLLAERGTTAAEAERWGQQWIPEFRRRLAGLETRARSLPPIDTGALDRITGAASAETIAAGRVAASVRTGTLQTLTTTTDFFETIARVAPAAATGDETATIRLGIAMLEGTVALLEVENLTTQQAMNAVGRNHPQYWLMNSIASSNKAMIEMFRAAADEALEPSFDAPAYARRIRGHIEDARRHAAESPRRAEAMAADLRRDPDFADTDFGRKLLAALATYTASKEVEGRICDELERAIQMLEREGSVISLLETGLDEIEPLADERTRIDSKRREDFAN